MQKITSNLKFFILPLILMVLFFFLGIYIGYGKRPWIERITSVTNKEPKVITSADFEPFWKAWKLIDEKYPKASSIEGQERVWGAIKGLIGSLDDPYSVFLTPEETSDFEESINGEFSGVGMEVGIKDKILTVISPLKGTPAEKSGVKSGDKILKIGDIITSDMSVDDAIKLIRGPEGTKIILTLFREGKSKPFEVTITRAKIMIPTIDSSLLDQGIYVISLYNFNAQSSTLFVDHLNKFLNSGSTKLILDLRGNPGGFLTEAVEIASLFLKKGTVIVKEDFGDGIEQKIYRSYGYFHLDPNIYKMVILVDEGSASASEILAGALSENNIATLIGQKTYGKGSVQELIAITDETSLKITVAKWLTPNGISISDEGLMPKVKVEIKDDTSEDDAMKKAIEYILK
jgi:carboxyl-terminal processing protease